MRISNFGLKQNTINQVQKNYQNLESIQNRMVTGKRYTRASQNPVSTINSVYQRTRLYKVEQYQNNTNTAMEKINVSHDLMQHSVNVLQDVRELTVQAANGIYGAEERQAMAFEVEELLREFAETANSKDENGFVFAGSESEKQAFHLFFRHDNDSGRSLIDKVEYRGGLRAPQVEVDENDQVPSNMAGHEVFWAQQHSLISTEDASGYIVDQNQQFRIDGYTVEVDAGDNLDAIVEKINNAVPSARAFKRELPDGRLILGMESTNPHQMMFEDIEGGQVLADLGITRTGLEGLNPQNNLNPSVVQNGGSVFSVLINLRNALLDNDVEAIGGKHLMGLDDSIKSLTSKQSHLSAVQNRLKDVDSKHALRREHIMAKISRNEDMDMAEASIEFNQVQNIHRLSLMSAAKIVQPTLMDFLR